MIEPIREYILSLDGDKDDFQDIFNDIVDNDVSKSTIFPDISIYRLYLNWNIDGVFNYINTS